MSTIGISSAEPLFPFEPDELLQRIPELSVRVFPDGSTFFRDHGWQPGHHGLRVLEAFSSPVSFRQVIRNLQSDIRGPQDYVDLVDTIRGLYSLGVLGPADDANKKVSHRVGFDAPQEHISMLDDKTRTQAYLRAISEVVREGDTVVEIGTGTGILSMAAARAGARHVYTIEAGAIGRSAQALFEANGLADRITLLSGNSTSVTLPERADVLLSEIIGNEPLQERVLESTADALQRFLIPEPRLLPRLIRVFALPVRVPAALVKGYIFTEARLTHWSEWYGVDFSSLPGGNPPTSLRIFVRPHTARDWVRVSEPVLVTEIDFASGHSPNVDSEVEVVAEVTETVNGLITFFELQLTPDISLSTNPASVDPDCSWRLPVWILSESLSVHSGDRLTLRYSYPAAIDRRVTLSR